jgi:YesN/AraC family two-component response regulator
MSTIIDTINSKLSKIEYTDFGNYIFVVTLCKNSIKEKVNNPFHKTHCHSLYEFHYVLDGKLVIKIGTETVILQANEFIIIKPHIYHTTLMSDSNNTVRSSFVFLCNWDKTNKFSNISSKEKKIIGKLLNSPKNYEYGKTEAIHDYISKISNEIKANNVFSSFCIQSSLKIIFAEIFRKLQDDLKNQNTTEKLLEEKRIYIIDSYFTENYTNSEANIKDLSSILCISIRQLERIILKIYGCSFTEKMNTIRIEESKHLLSSSDISTEIISEITGFSNLTYFYRVFKKLTGTTPSKFRETDYPYSD